jgi:hypothetical protein
MYFTDKDYIKGMTVAIYEGTTDGSWIARNADNILKSKALKELQVKHPGKVKITHLPYDQIDHVLAGWIADPKRPAPKTKQEIMEDQLYSAISVLEGRMENGAELKEAVGWLRNEVAEILKGKIVFE